MNPSSTQEMAQALLAELEQHLPPLPTHTHTLNHIQVPQPIHTVYGGAHLFKKDTVLKLGQKALQSFRDHAPTPEALTNILDSNIDVEDLKKCPNLATEIHRRIEKKLKTQPIEDYRIDFEDGFGPRSDQEEDETAIQAASQLREAHEKGWLPSRIGIRIKSLSPKTRIRGLKTLTFFLSELLKNSPNALPNPFVITLPKVEDPETIRAMHHILSRLETEFGLKEKSLKLEFMVETSGALMNSMGTCALRAIANAGEGRVLGAHLGAYDLTAALDVPAPFQSLEHPFCVLARSIMKLALEGTGLELADGTVNLLPIGDVETIKAAWRATYRQVLRGLGEGFYQGWDLHPAQIPPRYAAVYSFYLKEHPSAAQRLRKFLDSAAKASRSGAIFDDAASALGLLNFYRRGQAAGAFTEEDLSEAGLDAHLLMTSNHKMNF